MNEKGIATRICKDLPEFVGYASLYRIFPEVAYDVDGVMHTTNYVIVSAVQDHPINETFIFPADESGSVIDWGELDGSLRGDTSRGDTSHRKALEGAGYKLVAPSPVQA